jgi:hypothetical protein
MKLKEGEAYMIGWSRKEYVISVRGELGNGYVYIKSEAERYGWQEKRVWTKTIQSKLLKVLFL